MRTDYLRILLLTYSSNISMGIQLIAVFFLMGMSSVYFSDGNKLQGTLFIGDIFLANFSTGEVVLLGL